MWGVGGIFFWGDGILFFFLNNGVGGWGTNQIWYKLSQSLFGGFKFGFGKTMFRGGGRGMGADPYGGGQRGGGGGGEVGNVSYQQLEIYFTAIFVLKSQLVDVTLSTFSQRKGILYNMNISYGL